jgi:hypothetical protein
MIATPSCTAHKSSFVPVSMFMEASCHDIPGHRTHRQDGRHTTGYLASGRGRPVAGLLPRLARALAVVAPPAAGLRSTRLPLRSARHARLRPLEHLHAARGLRPGADRARHARALGVARPGQGGVDRPRLGQPGGLEHGGRIIPTGRSASPACACRISHRASRSRRWCRWSTVRSIPRPSIRGASGTTVLLRGELRQGAREFRSQYPQRRESAVPQGQPRGRRQALAHRRGAQGRRLAGAAVRGPTCRAMPTC